MTRLNLIDKYVHRSNMKRFDEKFPNDIVIDGANRRRSSPPLFYTGHHIRHWEEPLPRVREESLYELHAEEKLTRKLERRHSWNLGVKNIGYSSGPVRKLSSESTYSSSTSSIPEAIEESDEEIVESQPSDSSDYMHCINCSRKNNKHPISGAPKGQQMNYCYNCAHNVSKIDLLNTPLFTDNTSISSWVIKANNNNMAQLRKKRLSNSCDLPAISELTLNDDDNSNDDVTDDCAFETNRTTKQRKLGMSITDQTKQNHDRLKIS